MRDPDELMRATEAAFRVGGLDAAQALQEPPATSRRIVGAVAGVMSVGWTPVEIAVQVATTEAPVFLPKKLLPKKRRRASVMGAGCLIVTGTRKETDAELRERMKVYHRAVSATYAPVSHGLRTIWGVVEWGWCYPDWRASQWKAEVVWFGEAVYQVITEKVARVALTRVGQVVLGDV